VLSNVQMYRVGKAQLLSASLRVGCIHRFTEV
jgi:hypothetical protein